jgi:hypothetical protein
MRDEAGDCTRYAYAALQLVSRRYNRATMWDQLEGQLTGAPAVATIERKKGSWLTRSSP